MMKKALVLALAAVACAAWFASSELPELGKGDTDAASGGVAGFPSDRAGVSAARPRTFATLPDRGDLVSYPTPSPARVDGAYTWHRAELSEEHAFQSLQTGSLRITSPSGQPLEFEYSRHVEHPSGDWTWIGRLKGGQEADEAVITFGERAAFGAIAEPGKPDLRLTTSAGVAWLVETDPRKIATINSEATRPTGPDYLIPPEQQASPAASQPTPIAAASAPTASAAVAAAAATTVDVVVGYTAGFATALGGQSQAVTRLNNMVQIANEAYQNSQVDAEIRMVHALQVNYPDNTSNADTLEKLTGYRSGSGQVPVDPAFTALRAARDQYGGDLVTLVRRFQTPENDGCGIAWLLGGGQTGIDSGDASFGYSIVSDGIDAGTDGKNYFCRQETLVHELGHNMGSQHDRATATENGQLKYGVYSYSFGQKTDAANGNFYTAMAYGDSGQVSYRVFSNPRVNYCGGSACGVNDQADNARSLGQTMPIVATFRASVVSSPAVGYPGSIIGVGGKCLDGINGGSSNGTGVQVWACNGYRQQKWVAGSPAATFASYQTNVVLDVIGYGTANGTQLQLWGATGGPNQSWIFMRAAIVATGGRVLDAVGRSSANGTRLQLWDNVSGVNQQWTFDTTTGQIIGQDGKCLDVAGFGLDNGTPVQLWTCNMTENQRWSWGPGGTIVGYGGNCLEAANGGSGNGTQVRMWDCNGGLHQIWRIRGELRGVQSGKCLDDPGFGNQNGARVHIWECHGGANQQWEFSSL